MNGRTFGRACRLFPIAPLGAEKNEVNGLHVFLGSIFHRKFASGNVPPVVDSANLGLLINALAPLSGYGVIGFVTSAPSTIIAIVIARAGR